MTRRAITRADEAMVRAKIEAAWEPIARRLLFAWAKGGDRDALVRVEVNGTNAIRGLSAPEIEAIGRAGIHPGASGWEIEDAAGATRRPLPEGWAWLDGVYLTRRDDGASEIAEAKMNEATVYVSESSAVIAARIPARDTAHAREIAERVCWDRGLFTPEASPARPPLPPGFGWFERGVDSYSLDGPDGKPIARARASTVVPGTGVWQIGDGPWWPVASLPDAKRAAEDACRVAGLFDFIHVRVARVLGVEVERVTVTSDNASGEILRVDIGKLTAREDVLDKLRAAGFKVRPKVEADPAFPSDGGVEREAPTGAALALLRLVLRMLRRDETGMSIAAPLFPAELGILDGLCVAFVRELRREVAPAEKPRGIEDAAGAFVGSRVERELKFYKDMSDAAIEEARNANARAEDAERQVTAQRERAKRAEREARELAAAVHQVAAQRDEAREEARVSDLNAVELAADLAKLREGIRDLAARMGAPHG